MASKYVPEQSEEESNNFQVINVGKFWILKGKRSAKHLAFLDKAKDVVLNGNILLADDKLYEILTNKKGEYSFHKLEDVDAEIYFDMENNSKGKLEVNTDEVGSKCKEDSDQSELTKQRPQRYHIFDEIYDEIYGEIEEDPTCRDGETSTGSIADWKEREYNDQSEVGSTEENSLLEIGSVNKYKENEFDVNIEQSGLGKEICGSDGKMLLSICGNKEIVLINPKSGRITHLFQFNWIRRFGLLRKYVFFFEVGRRCPQGQGIVSCMTKDAKQISKILKSLIKA